MRDPEVLAIEKVAFEAWPAAEVEALGGWRLRFNHGITNRGRVPDYVRAQSLPDLTPDIVAAIIRGLGS